MIDFGFIGDLGWRVAVPCANAVSSAPEHGAGVARAGRMPRLVGTSNDGIEVGLLPPAPQSCADCARVTGGARALRQKHFALQYLCDSRIVAGVRQSTSLPSRLGASRNSLSRKSA